jgi:hypothetical protein
VTRLALASLLVLAALPGCTVLLHPGEAQCSTDADCSDRGFTGATCVESACVTATVVDPRWSCLGHVVEPDPDKSQKVPLVIHLALAADGSSVTKAVIDVCDKLDVDCSGTNPDFPKGIKPDAGGVVKLSVVQGFDGFVRITDTAIMPSRVYVGRPLMAQPKFKEVQLLRPTDYTALAGVAGQTVDPKRGTAILAAINCVGDSAAGVTFKSPDADAKSLQFYLINQAPATPPGVNSTDKDGFGGYFNLPPATTVARAYRASDQSFVGESSFQVLAGTVSYVLVGPSPAE